MYDGVASSGGWISVVDYEQTFELERTIKFLDINWTSDSMDHSPIYLYFNDDPDPVYLESSNGFIGSNGIWHFNFTIDRILVSSFKVKFSDDNTARNVNYYGYY